MKAEKSFTENRCRRIMQGIQTKLKLLHDQVTAVAQGYTTALFVYGPGGLGKTHHITSQLELVNGKSWAHHTAYSTPKGLMLSITQAPDAIHLFEDCEKLYKADVAASLLRAACGQPRSKERWVTYETAHEKLRVLFRGGIIIVSNEDISRSKGPMAAVASRFRPVEWNLTIDERCATILDMATCGWARGGRMLSPSQCREVALFLVEEMIGGKLTSPCDIRTYCEHALPAYSQWLSGESGASWQDVCLSKLHGTVEIDERRDDKSKRLQMMAMSLAEDAKLSAPQRVRKWKEQTGLGQAIYYRHLKAARKVRVKSHPEDTAS